ncbi:MAG: META domain-containing protein [Bacteroidales bacterium]|nr:META domain-containing protein [Bacteroidales bacterium]
MRLSILFLSLLSLVLVSCGGNKRADNDATSVDETVVEQQDFDQDIAGKYWKLIKLEGQDVEMVENQDREIYFSLNADDNAVSGFAGCNTITGEYELEEGNRIKFNNMGITMMMCPDVDVDESEFMEVFELTDNYTIHNDTLSLNIGRRAPLAVFEAVYM